jgi:hypothetical protein
MAVTFLRPAGFAIRQLWVFAFGMQKKHDERITNPYTCNCRIANPVGRTPPTGNGCVARTNTRHTPFISMLLKYVIDSDEEIRVFRHFRLKVIKSVPDFSFFKRNDTFAVVNFNVSDV